MKTLFIMALALTTSNVFAREINLTGLSAKAVYDSLNTVPALSIFTDGGMGKSYITIGSVECLKGPESMSCAFKSKTEADSVTLTSEKNYIDVGIIRAVLAEATGAEVLTSADTKKISLKGIECTTSGYSHVLDSIEIEVKYSCDLSL